MTRIPSPVVKPEHVLPPEVRAALAQALAACRSNPQKGYLRYALSYLEKVHEFAHLRGKHDAQGQIFYALNNLQAWRGQEARDAKRVLQKYAMEKDR